MYFLLDLVEELDLSAILIPAQAIDPCGEKGFDPRATMLLLYAYCVGTVSSRKFERTCYEDLAFRVLTGNQQQPDHSRISELRRRNLDALKGLFVQILRLCVRRRIVRTVWSGSVRPVRRWKRRPLLLLRVNGKPRLLRPEPRLMPPKKRTHQRLIRRS